MAIIAFFLGYSLLGGPQSRRVLFGGIGALVVGGIAYYMSVTQWLLDPGLGPVVSTVLSAYLIWEARRQGAPTGLLLRMAGNVGLDAVISAVPVAGTVADVFFRANLRNTALLRRHLERRGRLPW